MEKTHYWKVIGMGEFLLGYTGCRDTWLKKSIKEGWKKEQLTFIKLNKY